MGLQVKRGSSGGTPGFDPEAQMATESRFRLLGLPLVHIASGRVENGQYHRGIARGWIAVGDIAFGVVLAVGGVAVGGISLGGFGIGILAVGGMAAGVFAVGGLAFGGVAVGGAALAWWAASGGLAVARDFAMGGIAAAQHANDAAAQALVVQHPFFRVSRRVLEHSRWLVLLALLPVVMILLRRVRGARAGAGSGRAT
jgi:hypothetical protein